MSERKIRVRTEELNEVETLQLRLLQNKQKYKEHVSRVEDEVFKLTFELSGLQNRYEQVLLDKARLAKQLLALTTKRLTIEKVSNKVIGATVKDIDGQVVYHGEITVLGGAEDLLALLKQISNHVNGIAVHD